MRRLLLLPLFALLLALVQGPTTPARAEDKDTSLDDEVRLQNAFQGTEGASLVKYLATRARGATSPAQLTELIEGLDAKEASARQKACAELVAIGAPALPVLRQAARDVDAPKAAALARRCLASLGEDSGALTASVVRLLALRRPDGTAEALVAYLPHAESDAVREELKAALAGVAFDKGKANPALLKALGDENPIRRAAAVVALCSQGQAEPRATLRKLLSDPSPSVRYQASLALAQANDAKAVSTLITLLADLPIVQAREAETFLREMASDLSPKVTLTDDDIGRLKARDEWARWWLGTEGPGLLDEIKKRTLTDIDIGGAEKLIESLGDDSFEVREKAEKALEKMGARIVPLLKRATNTDPEVRTRIQKCLVAIEKDKSTPLSPVTFRLIALRRPKDAIEALLAYSPFADDETLQEEVQGAVNSLGFPGGKIHPALAKTLSDKVANRRSVAGVALCSGPLAETMPLIRRALEDKDDTVRLKVALALAAVREPAAVPALISLVVRLKGDESARAEDFLIRLAKDTAPTDLPEGDANRKKRGEAWEKWWTANKAKVVLNDRLTPTGRERFLGYTLLVQANNNQIVEMDKDKKVRWTMTGLLGPWDAQMLPGNRVLVAEYNGVRVTERNLKGEILWQVAVGANPHSAERLANGRTFVTCSNQVVEYDRAGKQVFKYDRPAGDIRSARRLPNGQIVIVTVNRQVIRLDRAGKEVKTAVIPMIVYYQNEILDNGNVLVPMNGHNYVAEYDMAGKEVWRANVMNALHAYRLPNGNTLVASQNWPNQIIEVDKKGIQVATNQVANGQQVFRVKRR
jgi:HEAT repeat protein